MKAVFNYNGEDYIIEVPLWLYHISQLSNKLASVDMDDIEMDEVEEEAYDFLTLECARIFAEHTSIDMESIFIEFYTPKREAEKEFGVMIGVS